MPAVVVRYTTKPDRADENAALIEKVFAALALAAPEGLRYASFRGDDGVSFVHVAVHEGDNPLATLPEFAEFQREIADRVEQPPVPMPVSLVGSYNFGLASDGHR